MASSGIGQYVQKGVALLQPDAGPNSYVRNTLAEDKWYSGKIKSPADKARVDAVREPLTALVATLDKMRAEYLPNYMLLAAMQPYLFHASLLSELNKLVEQISRERNVVLISEFNRRIASIVLTEPVPFLYERLGEKYEHILIDEFQDTSVLQWNNLLPLVENTLANGHQQPGGGRCQAGHLPLARRRDGADSAPAPGQHGGAGGAGPRAGDARAAAAALRNVSRASWSPRRCR